MGMGLVLYSDILTTVQKFIMKSWLIDASCRKADVLELSSVGGMDERMASSDEA